MKRLFIVLCLFLSLAAYPVYAATSNGVEIRVDILNNLNQATKANRVYIEPASRVTSVEDTRIQDSLSELFSKRGWHIVPDVRQAAYILRFKIKRQVTNVKLTLSVYEINAEGDPELEVLHAEITEKSRKSFFFNQHLHQVLPQALSIGTDVSKTYVCGDVLPGMSHCWER